MEILGKHVASDIHNAESHPTNYSPYLRRDWENLYMNWCWIMEGLFRFMLQMILKLRRVDVCTGTSVQRIAGVVRILHGHSFYLYHIQQGHALIPPDLQWWCFASRVSNKMCCKKNSLSLISCLPVKWDSTRYGIMNFQNTHAWCMTIPTPLWHQNIDIYFPSMPGWASYVIRS
jgi:hypothetical protein